MVVWRVLGGVGFEGCDVGGVFEDSFGRRRCESVPPATESDSFESRDFGPGGFPVRRLCG